VNSRTCIAAVLFATLSGAAAQVASHAPTPLKMVTSSPAAVGDTKFTLGSSVQVTGRPVVNVNGVLLTDRDLLREMYQMFPYARQHNNGFPKGEEEGIRRGALQMIEFEELVYQDASRRKMAIPEARLNEAVGQFRSQFQSEQEYREYLKQEQNGSELQLRKHIRRSLLIESALRAELDEKSKVTQSEAQQYYQTHPKAFQHGEMYGFQSISIVPPANATGDVREKTRQRAEDALKQARATKSYQDFGLLAEKISQDDFRVNMGDHRMMAKADLPPVVLKTIANMKEGQVGGLLQIDSFYTILRLGAHVPPGKVSFAEVEGKLTQDLHKSKYDRLRHNLDSRLRTHAKILEL
jgi:parvulin-like peptidyl-prolyl isomerase